MQQQQPPPPPYSLPPGWVAATDPVSGHIYFANPSTGETSWEPPAPPQPFNELESISAGKIADICHMQQNVYSPYKPLEPHLLGVQPPHTEEARLEIRIATLYDQLNKTNTTL
jgi:hypothetical protein